MTSRLDRLVTLLETGSTQLIRNTAAQQLADIQKKHPEDLFNLLTRIVPYLKSKSWDTRIAAAKAVGGIADNVEPFKPNGDDVSIKTDLDGVTSMASPVKKEDSETPGPTQDDQLRLETLDVTAILAQGKKLLGSAGQQYDFALAHLDPAERLAHQKRTLSARLGLGGDYTEEDLIDESDLSTNKEVASTGPPSLRRLNTDQRQNNNSEIPPSPAESMPQTPGGEDGSLSKRQLNMLKRKNKKDLKHQANKVRVVDFSERKQSSISQNSAPEPHAIKRESSDQPESNGTSDYFNLDRPTGGDDDSKVVAEFKGPAAPTKSELQPEAEEEGVEWPFERLCEYLMVDMFDHNWEVRHGAAMGLRELLRAHGPSAGRQEGETVAQNNILNRRWLDDLACRLCCIFMLDRFGDYVSDQVVAPVRETAGQTLGSILQHMPASSVRASYHILQRLILQDNTPETRVWQACHGGMIGMRYLVAVRGDLLLEDAELMNGVLEVVVKGLADFDDDVRAVSAATLIPVSEEVITLRPAALAELVNVIWDCLSNLSDDLSASTGSVMDLLAKLCGFPQVLEVMKSNAAEDDKQSFANLVPRLFPFLRHTITGVRSAALRALKTFLALKGEGVQDWIDSRTLRLLYQNLLVERNEGVLKLSLEVWMAVIDCVAAQGEDKLEELFAPNLQPLVALTLHPIGVPRNHIAMEPSYFIRPSGQVFVLPNYTPAKASPKGPSDQPGKRGRRKSMKADRDSTPQPVSSHNIDGPMIQGDVDLVGMDVMVRCKLYAAKGLAKVMSNWPLSSRATTFDSYLTQGLQSQYSSTETTVAIICEEYAKLLSEQDGLGKNLAASLRRFVEAEDGPFFADLKSYLQTAQQYCRSLNYIFETTARVDARALPHVGSTLAVSGEDWSKYSFSIKQGESVISSEFDKAKAAMTPSQRLVLTQSLDEAKSDAARAIREAKTIQDQRVVRTKAAAAAAVVAFKEVPKKPSLTIKGIMDSIKMEENLELQKMSASAIVSLVRLMVASRKRVVVDKVVGNLVNFYCADLSETPDFRFNVDAESGLVSLRKDEDIADHADPEQFEKDAKAARIQRRGAREGLTQLSSGFGPRLLEEVPVLKNIIESPLNEAFSSDVLPESILDESSDLGQRTIDGLSTLRAIVPTIHPDLHEFVLGLVPKIITAVKCKLAVLRYAAAKCLATICSVITVQGFTALVKDVLPSISNANDLYQRQGAMECVYHLIHVMEDRILPYVIFLIVPVLGRMSDSDTDIRLIATTAFATLVKLVPLEAGIPDPPGLSDELLEGRERERKFMSQMLDFKKVEPFEIPVAIKADLRSYQHEGVNWLAFLNRYHLHGVLCDDMGLGKTLQTLCIVASDHHLRAEEYAKTQSADVRKLPSLIVCPPTLSGHWQQEIRQFAPFLKAVAFVGNPSEREAAKSKMKDADIVITSYEICRNSIEYLAPFNWNYCVLDEGHLIKNPAAKTTLAVKRLSSNHRLILSGTPIQNNVLELWSLFDFLMPGFLGTEKVFKDRFAKPIAASRFSKSSSKEQEAGALAVEALHKQVLPFLLRRLKEEVLDDLPPKIIQNYYCELSEVQRKLLNDLNKSQGKQISEMAMAGDKESKQHIFTALNYMRKVCNSPRLVLKPESKQLTAMQQWLRANNHKPDVNDPTYAPKLGALCQLLVDCGIGTSDVAAAGGRQEPPAAISEAVNQHRVLIFCQMKEMLDIVQQDVLKRMLPSVTHLRLDGSVEANRRQEIVNKFNGDPSIDVLLLTTSVGGLGLNLTGADTVIFVEHDWNPQKDIQAMDRAHRIGQKKVVNVYRLITRGTLEEKILNLQRFKIDVASTVVNQQNAGLATMETDQILDLFNLDGADGAAADGAAKTGVDEGVGAVDELTGEVREKGKKGFLEDLGELWDESQYDEAFNLDGFLEKIKV